MSLNIEILKSLYIGTTINWLTVEDIYRRESDNRIVFLCRCKCNSLKEIRQNVFISRKAYSCGCYKKSKEFSSKQSEWYINNPDKVQDKAKRYSDWCKNNPKKIKEKSLKYSSWCKHNTDKITHSIESRMTTLQTKRVNNDYTCLFNVVHPDDLEHILDGSFNSHSIIRTRCPLCNKYSNHSLHNVFVYSTSSFRRGLTPLCSNCSKSLSTSHYENEIEEIIKSFYNSPADRNNRTILNGKELDLYYPDKHIAIEFNGNYWHSELFKDNNYHYNKFIQCRDIGITLVSIFESDWISRKELVIQYLSDLFNGEENYLSFNEDKTLMNNNYPQPNCLTDRSIIEDFYVYKNLKIFTCGYSRLL